MKSSVRRVLIVEDDAMVRRLVARHFEKQGAMVVEAADAQQAIDAYDVDSSFDIVITDVHLPGQTGLQLANRLRAVRADQAIVFITGDVDESLARRALATGNSGYLLKPFEFFELDAAVRQAVQASRNSQSHITPRGDLRNWYAEQQRLLETSAQRPVDVRAMFDPTKRQRWLFAARIGVTVVVLLLIAWVVGYVLLVA